MLFTRGHHICSVQFWDIVLLRLFWRPMIQCQHTTFALIVHISCRTSYLSISISDWQVGIRFELLFEKLKSNCIQNHTIKIVQHQWKHGNHIQFHWWSRDRKREIVKLDEKDILHISCWKIKEIIKKRPHPPPLKWTTGLHATINIPVQRLLEHLVVMVHSIFYSSIHVGAYLYCTQIDSD